MDGKVSFYIALGKQNSIESALWSYFYRDHRVHWDALLNSRDDRQNMDFLLEWLRGNIDGFMSAGIDRNYYIDWIEFESEDHLNWFILKYS